MLPGESTYYPVIRIRRATKLTGIGVGAMARRATPWAVVLTAVVSALVAAGALAMSATLRDRDENTADASPTTAGSTASGAGVDGCLVGPCEVLATVPVGGTTVDLVADAGRRSGRVRIGGAGSSDVFEVTITSMGATLDKDSLQCVAGSLNACLVRGRSDQGVIGQVVVGRSRKWAELTQPFQSDAGYLALDEVTADPGVEVLATQHRCDRAVVADCTGTPVYIQVYNLRSQEKGCTKRDYDGLESLPGWPVVALESRDLKACV